MLNIPQKIMIIIILQNWWLVYRIAPYFRGTQIPWFSYFLQNTNFRDNNFREWVTMCMESARLLDFRG